MHDELLTGVTVLDVTELTSMNAMGAALANRLDAGDILLLSGDLGAGKTTLCRAIIRYSCGVDEVPSPTFTLVETYSGPTLQIWHFDLYRLQDPSEIWELGVEEAFDGGVSLIEWPEHGGNLLTSGDRLEIALRIDGNRRLAQLNGAFGWSDRLQGLQTEVNRLVCAK